MIVNEDIVLLNRDVMAIQNSYLASCKDDNIIFVSGDRIDYNAVDMSAVKYNCDMLYRMVLEMHMFCKMMLDKLTSMKDDNVITLMDIVIYNDSRSAFYNLRYLHNVYNALLQDDFDKRLPIEMNKYREDNNKLKNAWNMYLEQGSDVNLNDHTFTVGGGMFNDFKENWIRHGNWKSLVGIIIIGVFFVGMIACAVCLLALHAQGTGYKHKGDRGHVA